MAATDETSLEIGSEDPLLREIDAELENALVDSPADAAEIEEETEVAADDAE